MGGQGANGDRGEGGWFYASYYITTHVGVAGICLVLVENLSFIDFYDFLLENLVKIKINVDFEIFWGWRIEIYILFVKLLKNSNFKRFFLTKIAKNDENIEKQSFYQKLLSENSKNCFFILRLNKILTKNKINCNIYIFCK